MGWTYFHKAKNETVKDVLAKTWNGEKTEVLETKIVGMRTAYMAIKVKETSEVFAAVFLLDYRNKEYCNFGYKDMDETMGPYNYDCPKSILDKLTPTTNEYALKWREECINRLNSNNKTKSIKYNDVIKFKTPFKFGSYGKASIFQKSSTSKLHFWAPEIGITVRLNKSNLTKEFDFVK